MKPTASFRAKADDGRVVTIIESQHYADVRTLDKPDAPPLETVRSLQTSDGRAVNRLSADEFEVFDPFGEFRVRRIR